MRLPKDPTPEEVNRFFESLSPAVIELSTRYIHDCISLGRPLTKYELKKYKTHPGYKPEFFDGVSGVKAFFRVYQRLRLEGKAGLGRSESREDQRKLVGYVLEDMDRVLNEEGSDEVRRRFRDEFVARFANFLRASGM